MKIWWRPTSIPSEREHCTQVSKKQTSGKPRYLLAIYRSPLYFLAARRHSTGQGMQCRPPPHWPRRTGCHPALPSLPSSVHARLRIYSSRGGANIWSVEYQTMDTKKGKERNSCVGRLSSSRATVHGLSAHITPRGGCVYVDYWRPR